MLGIDFTRFAGPVRGILFGGRCLLAAFVVGIGGGAVAASPWAEVGDAGLRSDIEILSNARLIEGPIDQWPMAWRGLTAKLNPTILPDEPDYVLDAMRRVRQAAVIGSQLGLSGIVTADVTNKPSIIRTFDALGRQDAQSQLSLGWTGDSTSLRLSIGAQTHDRYDHQSLLFDGSYLGQEIGNTIVYAGYVPHWWGPGWMSAMSLSNNARPFPHLGIMRSDPHAFSWPVLKWLGPWQAEFFAGVLDGSRINRNTIYSGLRLSVSPLPGLEIGVARMDEMCGTGQPCKPLAEYFNVTNNASRPNKSNDEGLIDIRYSGTVGELPFSIYGQEMNEVQSNPLPQSVSYLGGATLWVPLQLGVAHFTVEYATSVPTYQLFGSIKDYGFAYNNGQYPDGMRYRDRSLGFSLDSDSKLLTLSGDWRAPNGTDFKLTFHHANISDTQIRTLDSNFYNTVTVTPVTINMGEVGIFVPWRTFQIDLALRAQDDQPRPNRGTTGGIEIGITKRF